MYIKQAEPYLSIIVASRNDNHGGDLIKRMRIFLKALIHQCNQFKLNCELIIVEWNPSLEKELLNKVLQNTTSGDYLSIKYVVVPNEIHSKLAFADKLPLFQMIAKNVGIRRAKADFILCTNVDLIFSDELFARLAKKDLMPGFFYRANRCDVPNTIDENWTVPNQIEFCKANIKSRLGKNNHVPNFIDTRGLLFKHPVFLPVLKFLSKIKYMYARSIEDRLLELDLDACGDFTMMSKQDWLKIDGYPELEMYSIHIDSMALLAAAALGIKQVIFDWKECSYHMEHTGGWEFKNPIDKIYFYTNKPVLDWWTVRSAGLYIMENKINFNINNQNWGMLNIRLQEIECKN